MKTYEIVFRNGDNVDDGGDFVLWVRTDREITLFGESEGIPSIKEIDIKPNMAGVDMIIK